MLCRQISATKTSQDFEYANVHCYFIFAGSSICSVSPADGTLLSFSVGQCTGKVFSGIYVKKFCFSQFIIEVHGNLCVPHWAYIGYSQFDSSLNIFFKFI